MAKMRCLFVAVNVLITMKIIEGAVETAPDSQPPWTHKDTAASTGTTMTDGRNVISPRMDFEEWTPLGRGDPLKNDPTFDYLPPVLDRVHYWKSPPAASNRAHYYSSASTATPTTPPSQAVHGGYNRRFFLTDFSKREPVQAVAYAAIKRPPPGNSILQTQHHHPHGLHHPQQQQQMQHHLQTLQAVSAAGYHYSMHPVAAPVPRTPLPMLTPPPYQQWSAAVDGQRQTLSSSSSFPDLPGNAVAESKQPPPTMVRAPTRLVPPSPHHSSVVKALLDDEVDRTTVTTTGAPNTGAVWMTTMMTTTTTSTPPPSPPPPSLPAIATTPLATSTATRTTSPVSVTNPLFSHYRQSPVTGRPMYLIIQGHSKVKTYGLASKLDDLTVAPVMQDHNHIGNQPPDESSRRKRDHYHGSRR